MPDKNRLIWILRPLMRRDIKGIFRYVRGARWPAWFILAIPFILLFIFVLSKTRKKINWTAAIGMLIISEIMLMIVEHISVQRGHWVYNENRIIGIRIWGVPIEEPLIYYWIPQLFVVATMLFVHTRLRKKAQKKGV